MAWSLEQSHTECPAVEETLDESLAQRAGKPGRKLLHAARLRREKRIFLDRYGEASCEMMLGDCYWHVDAMIGKLGRRVNLMTALNQYCLVIGLAVAISSRTSGCEWQPNEVEVRQSPA